MVRSPERTSCARAYFLYPCALPVPYLAVSCGVVDQAGVLPGAAELGDGLRLAHHPAHALQVPVLEGEPRST